MTHGKTMVEFCDAYLMPCVDEAHREFIEAEAAKLAGRTEEDCPAL